MNKVILMGRLCADPEVRYAQNQNQTAIARYRLAVDRRFHRDGDATADFISCVAFGKAAEFAEKYLRQGQKVYTTDVVVEEQEFAESKSASAGNGGAAPQTADPDGFMSLPDGIDEELPFN